MNNFVDKPHMRREEWVSRNVIFDRKVYRWVCVGELIVGTGDTPREAYFDWLVNLRLNPSYTPDDDLPILKLLHDRALYSNMDKWRWNHSSHKKFDYPNGFDCEGFKRPSPGLMELVLKWINSAYKRFKHGSAT